MTIREYTAYRGEEILPLYESVGWSNYTARPHMLEEAYRNSLLTLAAYENEKLVGIVRTVGDGASVVLIQDILVLPEYQRQGIGTLLMKEVLNRFSHVYQIQLATDNTQKTIRFYRSVGFTPLDEMGCCGLMRMNL